MIIKLTLSYIKHMPEYATTPNKHTPIPHNFRIPAQQWEIEFVGSEGVPGSGHSGHLGSLISQVNLVSWTRDSILLLTLILLQISNMVHAASEQQLTSKYVNQVYLL